MSGPQPCPRLPSPPCGRGDGESKATSLQASHCRPSARRGARCCRAVAAHRTSWARNQPPPATFSSIAFPTLWARRVAKAKQPPSELPIVGLKPVGEPGVALLSPHAAPHGRATNPLPQPGELFTPVSLTLTSATTTTTKAATPKHNISSNTTTTTTAATPKHNISNNHNNRTSLTLTSAVITILAPA